MAKTDRPKNTPREARMITVPQAAKSYQIGERTLRRHIAEGTLVAYRLGRCIRLKPEDVEALFTPTNAWGRPQPRMEAASVTSQKENAPGRWGVSEQAYEKLADAHASTATALLRVLASVPARRVVEAFNQLDPTDFRGLPAAGVVAGEMMDIARRTRARPPESGHVGG